jgi:Ras-related protein Rab-8A
MGILLTYDVTDERSFNSKVLLIHDIRNWIRNIEQHASEGVNKILIGNKCDMLDKKVFSRFTRLFRLNKDRSWQTNMR